jgi:hypothetical protein
MGLVEQWVKERKVLWLVRCVPAGGRGRATRTLCGEPDRHATGRRSAAGGARDRLLPLVGAGRRLYGAWRAARASGALARTIVLLAPEGEADRAVGCGRRPADLVLVSTARWGVEAEHGQALTPR